MNKYKLLARFIANGAVRNSYLETLHGGKQLPKKYRVGYSRVSDPEMRKLMLEVEYQIAGFLEIIEKGEMSGFKFTKAKLLKTLEQAFFGDWGISWDIPAKKYRELVRMQASEKS